MSDQIYYSEVYSDDKYDYRHVTIPAELAKKLPNPKRVLDECEWRGLGICQSKGWQNYTVNPLYSRQLLFRRDKRDKSEVKLANIPIFLGEEYKMELPLEEISPRVLTDSEQRRKAVLQILRKDRVACQTGYLAVYIVDKFLSIKPSNFSESYETLGEACISIAGKLIEVHPSRPKNLTNNLSNLLALEIEVLKTLNFGVIFVTPVNFIGKFLDTCRVEMSRIHSTTLKFLLRLSMLEPKLYFTKAIAEACFALIGGDCTFTKKSREYAEILLGLYETELKQPSFIGQKYLNACGGNPMVCKVPKSCDGDGNYICTNSYRSFPQFEEKLTKIAKIGEGSYGVVYKGETSDGRTMVLKRIRNAFSEDTGIDFTVIRELSALRQFSHPNIIELRGISVDIDTQSIGVYMEPMDMNLSEYIPSCTMVDCKKILWDILQGIKYLHENNIWHRDLKPNNILISLEPLRAKIGDLGQSCFEVSKSERTPRVCNLNYRPPELLVGNHQYDSSIDMWGVGCIFAEMVNKTSLFNFCIEMDLLLAIFQTFGTPENYCPIPFPKFEPEPISNVLETEDNNALDLFQRMMCLWPERRITAAEALKHPFFDGF